jgi:hypothetical protein
VMPQSVQQLQVINHRVRDFIDRLGHVPNLQPELDPDQVVELLNSVLRAGECLRAEVASAPDPAWQAETLHYRKNLERLRGILPLLDVQLRAERARLEAERTHLEAASGWAASSRQTL